MKPNCFMCALLLAGLTIASGGLIVSVGCNRPMDYGPRAEAAAVEQIRTTLVAGAPKVEDAAETKLEATGWATIQGKFVVEGSTPEPQPLTQPKSDPACSKHGLVDETVIVKDGGLVGAAIFVRTPNMPVNPDLATPSGDVVLDNKNCRFEPHVVMVQTGQTLKVNNSDPFSHNTKIDTKKNPAQNFSLPAKDFVNHTFNKEELQPMKFGCSIHPWMGGWVIVRGNPYGAVSSDGGSFVISKLPAGIELEFQLWKEKSPKAWAGVTVEADGQPVKLDGKGRFKLKLEPDKDVALNITVPADALK